MISIQITQGEHGFPLEAKSLDEVTDLLDVIIPHLTGDATISIKLPEKGSEKE